MIDKERIEEEAKSFFEWPDPKHKDHVTLTSCLLFADTMAKIASAEERDRCAKLCEQADKSTHPADLADAIRRS